MSYFLTDNVSSVAWNPDYSPDLGIRKDQSVHRTPSGRRFDYKWTDFISQKHKVSFVTSADAYLFNNWWLNNTPLKYTPDYDATDVSTVILAGNKLPASKFEKPYDDLFVVNILLEELP